MLKFTALRFTQSLWGFIARYRRLFPTLNLLSVQTFLAAILRECLLVQGGGLNDNSQLILATSVLGVRWICRHGHSLSLILFFPSIQGGRADAGLSADMGNGLRVGWHHLLYDLLFELVAVFGYFLFTFRPLIDKVYWFNSPDNYPDTGGG